jgi:Domain of unknown function (DU1801)
LGEPCVKDNPMTDLPAPIIALEVPARRADAERLDRIFRDVTGWQPRLWGKLIGYGQYHYVYDSGHEGDFLATGFTPRARDFSLYILPGYSDFPEISARLGPHTRGKSCWYVKRLSDIDEAALRDLIRAGLDDLASHWTVLPT